MQEFKYNHDSPFEAFITNLNAYNNGKLVGEWVKFPTDYKKLEQVLINIGVFDFYQEWFISDYSIFVGGIKEKLYPYSTFEELNDIAKHFKDGI